MNLNGLKGFTEIVYQGSLAAAARTLNISEPALSRQIAALEHEIGLQLFSRDKRQLIVTEEGAAFLAEAQSILDSVAQIPEVVKGIKANYQRRIRLVTMPRLTDAVTAPALAEFRRADPHTLVIVDVQPRRFLERWIAVKNYDIGVGSLPAHHMAVETERILTLNAVAVLPPDHRMAGADQLAIGDLAGDPLIAITTGTLIRRQMEQVFERAKVPLDPTLEVSQVQLACSLVAAGAGYTVTDPLVASIFGDRVATVPVTPASPMDFGFLWPKERSVTPSVDLLCGLIRKHAAAFADKDALATGTAPR